MSKWGGGAVPRFLAKFFRELALDLVAHTLMVPFVPPMSFTAAPVSPSLTPLRILGWTLVAATGATCVGVLAWSRGEPLNALWMVVAALCTFAISYRFHSAWLMAKVFTLDEMRATPAETKGDGKDYVKTNQWVVFGHHFAAIAGPGPLVGPVLAAQFGYLPGMLWILIGATLGDRKSVV